ncbi:NADH:flavin oxidoreductase/NADH oxidase family protein [Mammaliicoccus sciuri]|nr:NADH:flavin oxidoreductase/NADH oxidase family protein [Mammaliicoccus sciuri]MCD8845944.1 NADH:flavin oxidoreductase/NADH oxidase family protein [Mammaliicoccus sciuri]MEB6095300.1 NADH:flavin oxidoreductase/NADH oxidase family protein [Mammaliicoccus sciuri]MEB6205500.1 NADH:flavin oxidoreductase/NADH oxidase family protein [Mammaliicoccus sciuri]MEB7403481.1 NADH:flavin oxidoreductase/NADH oxidase family protein [Mammaliicoccus sciuri]MEB7730523.1 NADH:flavin oxidoreductase/NADH oxidase 
MKKLETKLETKNFMSKNRFYKASMSETLGNRYNSPTKNIVNLYSRWSNGGSGILMTGKVMVDRNALGEPGNIVIEDERDITLLKNWAKVGTQNNNHLWMQINHPGKQSPKNLSKEPVAPSSIPVGGNLSNVFNHPRALKHDEILGIIKRFGNTAYIAKKAGFTGVQIHAAHGYLINQFLSPYHNKRNDAWGGSLENRMRFLMEVYHEIRRRTGEKFPIAVKLNSADFQRGGFTEEDSMKVLKAIDKAGIDLIEISGGNYENPVMFEGSNTRESTKKREAYFLDYADKARKLVNTPIVVTGGFRSAEGMEAAINSGSIDMVGIAKPLVINPDLPNQIINGTYITPDLPRITTNVKFIDKKLGSMLELSWYEAQFYLMAHGKNPNLKLNIWRALWISFKKNGIISFTKRR